MPTILSHPAVPLAIGIGLSSRAIPARLLAAGIAASIAPDADVYIRELWSAVGHRGVTHTLVFAILAGAAASLAAKTLHASRATAFAFVFMAYLSHPLLDMATNGGSGIPLFWPFSHERYFWPETPIEVSPLGVLRFISERGLEVLESELAWVWLPALAIAALLRMTRSALARSSAG